MLETLERMEAEGQLQTESLDDSVPSDPSEQQLALVGPDPEEAEDGGSALIQAPPQHYTFDLPTLQIPIGLLGQLNHYLLDNNYMFALDLQRGSFGTQLVMEPGDDFVSGVAAALAEVEQLQRGERPPNAAEQRRAERHRGWMARLGLVPRTWQRRPSRLRGVDDSRRALPSPQPHGPPPQQALIPLGQPPPLPPSFFAFLSSFQQPGSSGSETMD
jgi:hypothetical protein